MSDSMRLAIETNEYLDSLATPHEGSFDKSVQYRSQMIENGFGSPLKTLVAKLRSELVENSAHEAQDLKKHLKEIHYIASLKKSTLNRARVAIAAHKIAEAFEDFGQEELIKFLPIGGDHRKRLVDAGESAVDAYHSLISIFEQNRHPFKSATALISFEQNGQMVERTINIDADKDAQEHIKKIFGENARVVDVELKRKTVGLIKNHSTKVGLFVAASTHAAKMADEKLLIEEKHDKTIKAYNDILRKNKLAPDSDLSETDRFEDVKEQMQKEGFMRKVGIDWIMPDEFKARLHKRRVEKKKACISQAHLTVYQIMQRYYISFNKEGRAAYGSLPSILIEPEGSQLAALNELNPPGYLISNPAKLIMQKIEMEKNAPPISSKVWGPAFTCIKTGVSAKWVAEEFGVSQQEVEGAIRLIAPLVEEPQGRGAQFLQKLK